jgi:hypothetical protein
MVLLIFTLGYDAKPMPFGEMGCVYIFCGIAKLERTAVVGVFFRWRVGSDQRALIGIDPLRMFNSRS